MIPIEPQGSETLHLFVSNQSFEIDPVDIEVYIDGQPVVCDGFLVEGQHNSIEFDLSLDPGTHELRAGGDGGNVTYQDSFDPSGITRRPEGVHVLHPGHPGPAHVTVSRLRSSGTARRTLSKE